MINRILIRIKVIQILYAYLLVEKQFSLESSPTSPTREKRFAYSLYLDLLLLMIKISDSITQRGGYRPLGDTRFIIRLKSDEQIKSLLTKYSYGGFQLESLVEPLAEKIKDSALYKNFLKKRGEDDGVSAETVWREIFRIIIMPNEKLNSLAELRENYTMKGVEKASELVYSTFVNFMSSQDGSQSVKKMLRESLNKAEELYYRLLWLPVELTDLEERNLDERRHRYVTSDTDLNPNLRFVENTLVDLIRNNKEICDYIERGKYSWERESPLMLNHLLKSIRESELYAEYMKTPAGDEVQDYEFWKNVMRKIVFQNEYFLETIEENSVYWNDDIDIIGTFVIKTFRRLDEGYGVLPQFKDEEDAHFGEQLVCDVIKNKDQYRGYINTALDEKQWESERLAFMDVVIMETALAEILNFPKIPLNVSFNEYIEIAKSYGSAKSGSFINGLLGTVIANLQKENILHKQ